MEGVFDCPETFNLFAKEEVHDLKLWIVNFDISRANRIGYLNGFLNFYLGN